MSEQYTGLSGLRILVLGAGAHHERAFLTWARHGCTTTLVDGEAAAHYETLVDSYLPWEVRDYERPDLDRLTQLAEGHDVVLTLSEMAQMTTATIARRAGLRGSGIHAAQVARDKYWQRKLAAAAGLPSVASIRLNDPDRAAEIAASTPAPWIVKPADAGGSAAVSLVRNPAELPEACKRALAESKSGHCVIEEFVAGREWSVEMLVVEGVIRFHSCTAKTLAGPACFVERRHVVGASPDTSLDETLRRMVSMYKVDTALCHFEMRLDGAQVIPIEMAVRPAGAGIIELVRLVHGRDLYAELAAALSGRSLVTRQEPTTPYAGVEFLIANGTVVDTPQPVQIVRHAPGIRYLVSQARPGTTLGELEANWSRAGYAVATGNSKQAVERSLSAAMDAMATTMGVTRI